MGIERFVFGVFGLRKISCWHLVFLVSNLKGFACFDFLWKTGVKTLDL